MPRPQPEASGESNNSTAVSPAASSSQETDSDINCSAQVLAPACCSHAGLIHIVPTVLPASRIPKTRRSVAGKQEAACRREGAEGGELHLFTISTSLVSVTFRSPKDGDGEDERRGGTGGGTAAISLTLGTSLRAVYLLLFTQKMRL